MPEVPLEALQDAIYNLYGCDSVWVESVPVTESHEGEIVWDGEVQVFDLPGCEAAPHCYAWTHAVDGSDRRRFFVVLHKLPVDSPETAVRAAILSESMQQSGMPGGEVSGP